MESLLGMCTPQKAGVPESEKDSFMKEAFTICKDEGFNQTDAIYIIGQACRLVTEASLGSHRKIATGAFCPEGSAKALEKVVDLILEQSHYDLDKVPRAGEMWVVDKTTDEYKDTWEKLKK